MICQDVGEQVCRFDVAPAPTDIRISDYAGPLGTSLRRGPVVVFLHVQELERRGGKFVGGFSAPDGEHRCFLAVAGGEALLYDLPPEGPALCLAWVGRPLGEAESEGESEAKAVFASYAVRAAAEGRPLCRSVGAEDIERLPAPEGDASEDSEAQADGERRAA